MNCKKKDHVLLPASGSTQSRRAKFCQLCSRIVTWLGLLVAGILALPVGVLVLAIWLMGSAVTKISKCVRRRGKQEDNLKSIGAEEQEVEKSNDKDLQRFF